MMIQVVAVESLRTLSYKHEPTAHEPQVAWICCKIIIRSSSFDNLERCVFCLTVLGGADHDGTTHKVRDGRGQLLCHRDSFRKDQSAQHIRHFHQSSPTAYVDAHWKFHIDQTGKKWQCGIFFIVCYTWKARMKHIGEH
jgi:hypothetical protein